MKDENKIVIISPVRNEFNHFPKTIDSMLRQSLKPIQWIIVDDGSTDNTWELIKDLNKKYSWIFPLKKEDRGSRIVGPGVVESFYFGFEYIKDKNYEFICKMDGDIMFHHTYFSKLISYFDNDKYLGAASGKPFIRKGKSLVEERTNNEMVCGQINFYKKKCFEEIGGFVKEVHWDAIAFHRARMSGWRTKSINDTNLNFIHLRVMGSSHKSIVHGRLRWGKGQYFLGTHPLYLIFIALYRSVEYPFVIGGLCIIIGYCKAALKRMRRYEYLNFRKSLHAWQLERLCLARRLEKIPDK